MIRPRFPNATYWSNRQHWNWALSPNEREKASFLAENIKPLEDAGVVRFLDEKKHLMLFCPVYRFIPFSVTPRR